MWQVGCRAKNLFSAISGNGLVPDVVTYSLMIESHRRRLARSG
jgi:hypothetical protein